MAKPKMSSLMKKAPTARGAFCVEQKKGAKKKLAPGSIRFQTITTAKSFTVTRTGCPVGKFRNGKCHAFRVMTHVARRVPAKNARCPVGRHASIPQ